MVQSEIRRVARTATIAVMVALFGTTLYGLGRAQGAQTPAPAASDEPAAAVAERLAPSVVRIEHAGGQGSGVVYDEDGLILTAGHVVTGASEVTVRTAGDDTLTGEVVGIDPATDVGVVDVDVDLPVPALGDDDDLRVGQLAVAIGSPYGLDESVTLGIVSALDRDVTTQAGTIEGLVQTDAPINPGNSGGPLADREGRVIGINHAIASSSGGNEGVGFAVPIGVALESAEAVVAGDVAQPEDHGLVPDMPFPEMPPLDEWEPFGEDFPHPPEGLPSRECFAEPPLLEPADVPMPGHVPTGWQITSVVTNRVDDGEDDVLHEVELTSGDQTMTITLGTSERLDDRIAELDGGDALEVAGSPASFVDDGGRVYLIFELHGSDGLIEAPSAFEPGELVRVAESIR